MMQAYLIMAYNDFDLLKTQIELLDYPENDLFIHIDKKTKNFQERDFHHIVKYSNLYFIERKKVSWGGYSQIECEIHLLKEAKKKNDYDYYHLLSGVDLPIKPIAYIYNYFKQSKDVEYISFDKLQESSGAFLDRMKYYYPFQDEFGRNSKIITKLQLYLLSVQKKLKVDRLKDEDMVFRKGTNWFSITNQLAEYVLAQESYIKKLFSMGWCVDEVFLQTFAWNSKFKYKISGDSMRMFDWERGTPYVYRKNDFNELINSNKLFARKFSNDIDAEIIQQLKFYLLNKRDDLQNNQKMYK